MKKIIIPLLVITLLVIGCKKDNKFYLEDKYYNTEERFVVIESKDLQKLMKDKESFVVFTYLPYCTFSLPCDVVFETFMNEHKMSFYSIPFDEFTNVDEFKSIKYAPSVVLVNKGKIVKYLDANSDEDYDMYQDVESFTNWITKYVNVK